MKFVTKKGLKSIVPLRLKGKSATRFCFFPKIKAEYGPGNTPVYLNVYDLTPMNGYAYWAGLGIFHSGVEVHGVEYAFGAHDYPSSGVFEVEPRQCPGFKFRKSILIGTTCLTPGQVREFMEHHAANYNGNTYHLIIKNCNHFCNDICYKLTGKQIPKWVNRLAKLGNNIIPPLNITLDIKGGKISRLGNGSSRAANELNEHEQDIIRVCLLRKYVCSRTVHEHLLNEILCLCSLVKKMNVFMLCLCSFVNSRQQTQTNVHEHKWKQTNTNKRSWTKYITH
ncbi:putative PPPDE peptidase domain-containing protein [Helianthus debilis subsp. tardiflorus]